MRCLMKELIINKENLPIVVKYENKEYIIKATPKGLLMTKKEY